MYAPIIIFVYNRVDRVKNLIVSLSQNAEAKESDLFIFSDGSKNDTVKEKVAEVRRYIDTIPNMNIFRSVSISKAEKNKGLANSIIDGVSYVINRYEKAIIIEDDITVSSDFLDYMNRGLDFYEQDSRIWAISGFSRAMSFPDDYQKDVFLLQRMSSYTWATWKNRWQRTDWKMNQYPGFLWNAKERRKFDKNGEDRSLMLDAQACGKISSWAIRFEYSMMKNNMFSVFPVSSRSVCSGNDGSGTHSKKEIHTFDTTLSDTIIPVIFERLEVDERIRKEFIKPYKQPWYRHLIRNVDKILLYYFYIKKGR